jgi:cytochrome c oxidase cbb3-type subunit 3
MRQELLLTGLALCALLSTGCERERRRFDTPPLPPGVPEPRTVSLHVGPSAGRTPVDVSQAAAARAGIAGATAASAAGAASAEAAGAVAVPSSVAAPAPSGVAMAASMARADRVAAATSAAQAHVATPPGFEENAYAVSQGKRWYRWFNCNGCHAMGGGGSGPPLMDDQWRYGGSAAQIVATLRQGRPNGMPSFEGRMTEEQLWQLAAYVRSMSGQLRTDVAPGRSDGLSGPLPETRRDDETPRAEAVPKAR